ncbi:hypothetical protein [Bacillus sp. ISL-34]|uniref:hypothetical protein n=1 Tax=Bacillus sp. ISL-34 TaxID=2819121 RepID=UPI002570F83D
MAEEFPYHDKACYVLSRSTKGKEEFVEFVNEDVGDFKRETQVDEDGIRLFQSGSPEIRMKLTKMQQYGQIAKLHYQREK